MQIVVSDAIRFPEGTHRVLVGEENPERNIYSGSETAEGDRGDEHRSDQGGVDVEVPADARTDATDHGIVLVLGEARSGVAHNAIVGGAGARR